MNEETAKALLGEEPAQPVPSMTPETNEANCADPLVAKFCYALGCMSVVGGPCLVVLAAMSNTPQLIAPAFLIMFGSVLWFALARIIILLAQIAHNKGSG